MGDHTSMPEEVEEKDHKKVQGQSGRKLLPLFIGLALLGCIVAAVIVITGMVDDNQKNLISATENKTRYTLNQATAITRSYINDRNSMRLQVRQSLTREAATICGDVQVFLQAALVKREAEEVRRQNEHLTQQRDKLAEIARDQAGRAAQLAEKITPEKLNAMTETTSKSTTDGVNVDNTDVNNFFNSSSTVKTEQDKIRDIINEFSSSSLKDIQLAQSLEKLKNDRELPEDWPVKLLRECGPDLESLLPDSCTFTVAEAGGHLLMALGGGKATLDEVRGEASRTLLFSVAGKSYHWVLRTVLADINVAPKVSPQELVAILNQRLGLDKFYTGRNSEGSTGSANPVNDIRISGYIFKDKVTVVGGFGDDASAASPRITTNGWNNTQTQYRLYLRSETIAPQNWSIALYVSLPNVAYKYKIRDLVEQRPYYASIFIISLALVIIGIIIVSVIAWLNSSARRNIIIGSDAVIAPDFTLSGTSGNLKPMLGSLDRLQKLNRGKNHQGSQILDMAKSQVLRDLAKRIRSKQKQTANPAQLRQYTK